LQLRKFEEEFKQMQILVNQHISMLNTMTDTGDSVSSVEAYLKELDQFELESNVDVEKAEQLKTSGEGLIADDHYAVDCIRPKCLELQRMCQQYRELVRHRHELLQRARDLHDRIEKAKRWCSQGAEILAADQAEQCSSVERAERAIIDIDSFLQSADDLQLADPKEFRACFEDMITPDVKVTVQSVLKRMEDIQSMCSKKKDSLKRLSVRLSQPVHVIPEVTPKKPSVSEQHKKRRRSLPGNGFRHNSVDKINKAKVEIIRTDGNSSDTSGSIDIETDTQNNVKSDIVIPDYSSLQAKRGHVMKELIETERVYVSELRSVLQGYADEMDNPAMLDLIPVSLLGNKDILFGNMQEIYNFHANVFLKDLENCRETPGLVGRCFVDRNEEFKMYSQYCQNKPRSEALRREVGDNNPFFKECQAKLEHRLPLGAYLLKPVQRITKYQLLLKEMLKYTESSLGSDELQAALDTILGVLKYVNDIMHQVAITGYNGDILELGKLLMQGSFSVSTDHKKDLKIRDLRFKPMQRHIFLYQKSILFCKSKETQQYEKATYIYKNSVDTSNIGLTENCKGDKKKFEIWMRGRSEVYVIQAPSMDVKEAWVRAIKEVLMSQFDQMKGAVKKEIQTVPLTKVENSANNNHMPSLSSLGSISAPSIDSDESPRHPGEVEPEPYSEEGDWSSEEEEESTSSATHSQQEIFFNETQMLGIQEYTVLAEYTAVDSGEITLHEGDLIEVLKIGSDGWWYVRCMSSGEEGWAPASYLDMMKRRSRSTVSISSSESATGLNGLRNTASRSSVNSSGHGSSNGIVEETLV